MCVYYIYIYIYIYNTHTYNIYITITYILLLWRIRPNDKSQSYFRRGTRIPWRQEPWHTTFSISMCLHSTQHDTKITSALPWGLDDLTNKSTNIPGSPYIVDLSQLHKKGKKKIYLCPRFPICFLWNQWSLYYMGAP